MQYPGKRLSKVTVLTVPDTCRLPAIGHMMSSRRAIARGGAVTVAGPLLNSIAGTGEGVCSGRISFARLAASAKSLIAKLQTSIDECCQRIVCSRTVGKT